MVSRSALAACVVLSCHVALTACGDDDSGGAGPDAAPDGGPPADAASDEGGGRPIDAFNGDCTTARWADVSDDCWSCLCGACAETLDACEDGCIDLMMCALDRFTLVDNLPDIQCEIDATRALCLADGDETTWGQAATFDTCLITAPKSEGGFRVCEAECGIEYSGDVCERFPPPDGGVDGG